MKVTPELRKAVSEVSKHALAVQRYVLPGGKRHLVGLLDALSELRTLLEEKESKQIGMIARPPA
jgi:hypothetical protein